MNINDREKCRNMIEQDGWNPVGIIFEYPSILLRDKLVQVCYENMDGQAVTCNAIYHNNGCGRKYFIAADGPAKDIRLCNVVAWKEIEDQQSALAESDD